MPPGEEPLNGCTCLCVEGTQGVGYPTSGSGCSRNTVFGVCIQVPRDDIEDSFFLLLEGQLEERVHLKGRKEPTLVNSYHLEGKQWLGPSTGRGSAVVSVPGRSLSGRGGGHVAIPHTQTVMASPCPMPRHTTRPGMTR